MSGPARLDPRSLKTLLKLVKDYTEFSEVTVSVGDLTLSVKRGPAHEQSPVVTKPAKPRQAHEPRHAIASLGEMPPAFSMGNG